MYITLKTSHNKKYPVRDRYYFDVCSFNHSAHTTLTIHVMGHTISSSLLYHSPILLLGLLHSGNLLGVPSILLHPHVLLLRLLLSIAPSSGAVIHYLLLLAHIGAHHTTLYGHRYMYIYRGGVQAVHAITVCICAKFPW